MSCLPWQPTGALTARPSGASPSRHPTKSPANELTQRPSAFTSKPTLSPTDVPSFAPSTNAPTEPPSEAPPIQPTTLQPTTHPTTEVRRAASPRSHKRSVLTSSQLNRRHICLRSPPVLPVLAPQVPALHEIRRYHPPMSLRRDHLLRQRDHPRVILPTLLRLFQPHASQRPIPTLR